MTRLGLERSWVVVEDSELLFLRCSSTRSMWSRKKTSRRCSHARDKLPEVRSSSSRRRSQRMAGGLTSGQGWRWLGFCSGRSSASKENEKERDRKEGERQGFAPLSFTPKNQSLHSFEEENFFFISIATKKNFLHMKPFYRHYTRCSAINERIRDFSSARLLPLVDQDGSSKDGVEKGEIIPGKAWRSWRTSFLNCWRISFLSCWRKINLYVKWRIAAKRGVD